MIGSYRWYIQDQEVPENVKDTLGKYYEYGYLVYYKGWPSIIEPHNHTIGNVKVDKVPVLKTPSGDYLLFRTLNDRVMLELHDHQHNPKPLTLDIFDQIDTYGGTWLPWILYDEALIMEEMMKITPEFKNLILESYYLGDYIRDLPVSTPIDFKLGDGSILKIEIERECEVYYHNKIRRCTACGIFLYHEPTKDYDDPDERMEYIWNMAKNWCRNSRSKKS